MPEKPPEPKPPDETPEERARRIMRETAYRKGARLHPSEPVPTLPDKGGEDNG